MYSGSNAISAKATAEPKRGFHVEKTSLEVNAYSSPKMALSIMSGVVIKVSSTY
jgi:hypothetical protein